MGFPSTFLHHCIMNEPLWIDKFKSSVSWGGQVHEYHEHEFGFPILATEIGNGTTHYWLEANQLDLSDLSSKLNLMSSIIKARKVTAVFTGEQLVAADVERLMHAARDLGCAIEFQSVKAQVIRNRLLLLYSEGAILDFFNN
jgi:hypothetical protein